MCGGAYRLDCEHCGGWGLSPRVRGSLLQAVAEADLARSIPACAGEPTNSGSPGVRQRVYPRVCGGAARQTIATGNAVGLSPRVRGSPLGIRFVASANRSIPACAGEPTPLSMLFRSYRVYPRVCGGAVMISSAVIVNSGLSPRVRGSPPAAPQPRGGRRSIPACAGEPMGLHNARFRRRVYPRVCGGATDTTYVATQTSGLSPRVRGSRYPGRGETRRLRSIPACAGEPPGATSIRPEHGVYPRVCGGAGCCPA